MYMYDLYMLKYFNCMLKWYMAVITLPRPNLLQAKTFRLHMYRTNAEWHKSGKVGYMYSLF